VSEKRLTDINDMRELVDAVLVNKEQFNCSIEQACKNLAVSPSNYYYYRKNVIEAEGGQPGNNSVVVTNPAFDPDIQIPDDGKTDLEEAAPSPGARVDELVCSLTGETPLQTALNRWIGISQALMSEESTEHAQTAGALLDELIFDVQKAAGLAE
jgi:hypothetical protein